MILLHGVSVLFQCIILGGQMKNATLIVCVILVSFINVAFRNWIFFFKSFYSNIGNQFPGQGVPAGFSMYPAFSPLQMIWWQQMYARQYYMQ